MHEGQQCSYFAGQLDQPFALHVYTEFKTIIRFLRWDQPQCSDNCNVNMLWNTYSWSLF